MTQCKKKRSQQHALCFSNCITFLLQPDSGVVVVGSHCSSKLHCFGLLPGSLNSKAEFRATKILELNPDTKPKGLCLIPGNTGGFLALLGKTKSLSNLAFPPSGVTEHYDVSLHCFRMVFDKSKIEKLEDKFDEPEDREHCLNQGERFSCGDDKGVELLNCDTLSSLRLPDGGVTRGLSTMLTRNEIPKLISELKPSDSLEVNGQSKETFSGVTHEYAKYCIFVFLQSKLYYECQLLKVYTPSFLFAFLVVVQII